MSEQLLITSLQNQVVKQLVKLRDRRDREETELFLIEGYRELTRAVENDITLMSVFFCPEFFLGENETALIQRAKQKNTIIYQTSSQVFEKVSYRDRPDGLLAVGKQMKRTLKDISLVKNDDPFLIVAEAIEKPGNLGTILRSADAVNVDGIIVCDRCTDIYNPNVVRASVGTLFTRPVVEASTDETLSWLRSQKITIVAATPYGEKEFTDTDLTGPVAIVVGTEQVGLSETWLSSADVQVRIPMLGAADSLNVATATTLLLYEVLRQRRNAKKS